MAERLACRLDGDPALEVSRVTGLEQAESGDLTFFANPRYKTALQHTRATAVILGEDAPAAPCAMLRTKHPYLVFARALRLFDHGPRLEPGIDSRAAVDPSATIGEGVGLGPFVTVGAGTSIGPRTVVHAHTTIGPGARLGCDCVVHSNVSIREHVTIGDRVILQNGAVIGADGFGFARCEDGVTHEKIPQLGTVVVEDDVEIGANATIDRPAVGVTIIGRGTKIDNLVQVAHGVVIGQDVLLAAQVGIAGSTRIEDQVVLAGQVGVAGHLTIGRGAIATAQTGIPNDVAAGARVSGYPAVENRDWLRSSAIVRRLPELRALMTALERRLTALEERLGSRSDQASAETAAADEATRRPATSRP